MKTIYSLKLNMVKLWCDGETKRSQVQCVTANDLW